MRLLGNVGARGRLQSPAALRPGAAAPPPPARRGRAPLRRPRAAADVNVERTVELDGGDYYSILGIHPRASTKEVKAAYRASMRTYHPDQSDRDEEGTEFAAFLNQVYETLMDPDNRAEYDAISGFSVGGTNPFTDAAGYERTMAFVDEFACIGCRNCNGVCPKTFAMEEEHGRARAVRQDVDTAERLQEAIDTCPVSCIHWVTAPQLTLLEEAMAKMERVGAWLLRSNGGKGANLNVFFEASIAWEKRQNALREREQRARWAWAPFAPAAGSAMQNGARKAAAGDAGSGDESDDGPAPPPRRRVSAANIAAAARRWRDFQRSKRQKKALLLSE